MIENVTLYILLKYHISLSHFQLLNFPERIWLADLNYIQAFPKFADGEKLKNLHRDLAKKYTILG